MKKLIRVHKLISKVVIVQSNMTHLSITIGHAVPQYRTSSSFVHVHSSTYYRSNFFLARAAIFRESKEITHHIILNRQKKWAWHFNQSMHTVIHSALQLLEKKTILFSNSSSIAYLNQPKSNLQIQISIKKHMRISSTHKANRRNPWKKQMPANWRTTPSVENPGPIRFYEYKGTVFEYTSPRPRGNLVLIMRRRGYYLVLRWSVFGSFGTVVAVELTKHARTQLSSRCPRWIDLTVGVILYGFLALGLKCLYVSPILRPILGDGLKQV